MNNQLLAIVYRVNIDMTEAFTAFIKYLFNFGYNKIHIAAHVDNIGSNRVIQKCGFTLTHQENRDLFKGEPALINWYERDKE